MNSALEAKPIHLEKKPSALPKVAVLVYWAATVQYFYPTSFMRSSLTKPHFTKPMPASLLHGLVVVFLAYGILKLLLAYKLANRRNWARVLVIIIAGAQAVLLIQGSVTMGKISGQAVFDLFASNWGLYVEVTVAALLLLPQSRNWFAQTTAI